MNSLFICNNEGSLVMEKHFGRRLSRDVLDPLLRKLSALNGEFDVTKASSTSFQTSQPYMPPAFSNVIPVEDEHYVLLCVQKKSVILIAVADQEMEPMMIIEALHKFYEVMAYYLNGKAGVDINENGDGLDTTGINVNEDTIRRSFTTIYTLMDIVFDSGFPSFTELNIVQLLLPAQTLLNKALQLVDGPSRMLSNLAANLGISSGKTSGGNNGGMRGSDDAVGIGHQIGEGMGFGSGHGEGGGIGGAGSDIWWRKGNVSYASHEVYMDVVEKCNAVIDRNGKILDSSITGVFLLNTKLSGVPELSLSLKTPSILKAASFHPCIKLNKWRRDQVLCFCPPDGSCTLAEYWLPNRYIHLPVKLSGNVNFPPPPTAGRGTSSTDNYGNSTYLGSIELILTCTSPVGASAGGATGGENGSLCITSENVSIRLPLPKFIIDANSKTTSGNITYDATTKVIFWSLPSISADAAPMKAHISVTMSSDRHDTANVLDPDEVSLVAEADFLVKNWVPSGMKLDTLEVQCVSSQPYKGCRYSTLAGSIEFRL